MPTIAERLQQVRATLPEGTTLVAVSKFHPIETLLAAYAAGQRHFGESYVTELLTKQTAMPDDVCWHLIGHLQRNKVRLIIPFVHLIHSVDSPRLVAEIQRQAEKIHRVVDILLEIHIAQEATKSGFTYDDCIAFLSNYSAETFPNIHICGLMTMASNTDDEAVISREFATADRMFNEIKRRFFPYDDTFCQRSWGMSDDYPLALQHHATLVRLGTIIFGPRQ